MSGLFRRMFYSRHDAKFLVDTKQGSKRHAFSAFPVRNNATDAPSMIAGRGHSRKNSRDLDDIDEDGDNTGECSSSNPTVKRLMEDELGKGKQLKIPNDEVERILADLGHGFCLDKSSTQNSKSKQEQNNSTSFTMAVPSRSSDPTGSNRTKEAEENELGFALADFLGQIHRYHDEGPHKNCKHKVLIQTKIDELDNPPCTIAYEKTPQGEERDSADGKHLCSRSGTQPEKFRDALEMLSSDNELFQKILQKPNSHVLESVQRRQNRQIGTRIEPTKMPEDTDSNKDIKGPNQNESPTKTHGKQSRRIFFWKKERSDRRHTAEGTNNSQAVNKIVILKPNARWIGPAAASSTQASELSATGSSKFSITEVRRRFRIVHSEPRKGRPSLYEDSLQKDPNWFKSSAFTIKKDTRQLTEQTSEEKSSSTTKRDFGSSTSSRQKKENDGPTEININIITSSKDESVFYDEAKKHLTYNLKDKSQTDKHPTLQISRSLVRILSLPQCSTPSPRSSPRETDCIYLCPEEENIHAIYKSHKEEFAKEESQSGNFSVSDACDTSEAQHEQAVQEKHYIKEESQETRQEEEIDKLDFLEKNGDAWCILAKQHRYKPSQDMTEEAESGQEHVEMFPCTPENDVEKLEFEEPSTPRPSAPIEQISQLFPDGNHEKQEQPSPISVLDPFFHDDIDCPDSEKIIKCSLQGDVLRPHYTTVDNSKQGIFWEDKDARLGYIKELLELSELCTYENLEVWYLEDELISPCLFEELHQGKQIDDTKLLFDCICEAVAEIQGIYFRSPPCLPSLRHTIRAPPTGRNLISEINKYVERHLHHQFPSTLDQLISKDLEDGSWMDLPSESEEITVVIWDCMLDELLEEFVYDLWI